MNMQQHPQRWLYHPPGAWIYQPNTTVLETICFQLGCLWQWISINPWGGLHLFCGNSSTVESTGANSCVEAGLWLKSHLGHARLITLDLGRVPAASPSSLLIILCGWHAPSHLSNYLNMGGKWNIGYPGGNLSDLVLGDYYFGRAMTRQLSLATAESTRATTTRANSTENANTISIALGVFMFNCCQCHLAGCMMSLAAINIETSTKSFHFY